MKNKNHQKIILFVVIALLLTCAIMYYVHIKKKEDLRLAYEPQSTTTNTTNQIEMVYRYLPSKNSYQETLEFAMLFKQQIENEGVHKLFFNKKGKLIKNKESDVHDMFKLISANTSFDRNHEPNNGLGAPDFTFSRGKTDKTVLEIKLACNTTLKNLPKQVEAYLKANNTNKSVKIILAHTEKQHKTALKTIENLGLIDDESVVLIDASFNKETGSKRA